MSHMPWVPTLLLWAGLLFLAACVARQLVRTAFGRVRVSMSAGAMVHVPLDGAVALLESTVAEQNDPMAQRARALMALDAMDDGVMPPVAIGVVRRFLPVASPGALHQLLVEQWRATKARPVLAAIAGLSLDPSRDGVFSLGLHEAWAEADANVLRYLAGFVETHFDALDDWLGSVDTVFAVEEAARRIETEDAALAMRLRALAVRVGARSRVVLMRYVERAIAWHFEDVSRDEYDIRPRDLAMGLGMLCVPRFAELMQAGHALFDRQAGTDWVLASLVLDLRVIEVFGPSERLAGFDFAASRQRFYAALTAHDAGLSEDAAFLLVELMELGYFCDGYALALFTQAMDLTANLHWPRPDGHMRLLDVLEQTMPQSEP